MKNMGLKLENSYLDLPDIFYTVQNPSKAKDPKAVKLNFALAKELGIDEKWLEEESLEILSGNENLEDIIPIAQAYAGHQFGNFTMLGDGRAILLGEYVSKKGDKVDIQLKGSGKTPYSRGGDGRAAIGPMLREYIISEAMHGLGIPTTRSLAVIKTGEDIIREEVSEGAVLTRVASSHIRVGTFEFAARMADFDDLKALADYTIKRHYKEGLKEKNPYLYLLREVIKNQAELIAKWQLVGFIHGVMNTDNMTISGETIDYGPCAFMDSYSKDTVFSSIDYYGRYAYGNQPNMAGWNLARFAETLIPLLSSNKEEGVKLAQSEINKFFSIYEEAWLNGMRGKLGLFTKEDEDINLVNNLLEIMENSKADYTNTFRALTLNNIEDITMANDGEFQEWLKLWKERLTRQEAKKEDIEKLMKENNPSVIPRNHRIEEAIKNAVDNSDYTYMDRLLNILSNPYEYSKEQEEYIEVPNDFSCKYRTFCGT